MAQSKRAVTPRSKSPARPRRQAQPQPHLRPELVGLGLVALGLFFAALLWVGLAGGWLGSGVADGLRAGGGYGAYVLPVPLVAIVYDQLATLMGPTVTSKANDVGESQLTTLHDVFHDFLPLRFSPTKLAPRAGPVAPLAHLPPVFSGDHLPMFGRSLIKLNSTSGDAAIFRLTTICSVMSPVFHLFGRAP